MEWLERSLQWLETTPIALRRSASTTSVPLDRGAVHVLAIVLVVGTISIIDLRLLGVASLDRAVTRLMGDVLP